MSDLISRQQAIDKINERQRKLIYCFGFENDMVKIMDIAKSIITIMPSAQPELDIWNDGTLHISVSKGQLDKIGRVLVEEDGTIFFRLFYQDAEPEIIRCKDCKYYREYGYVNGNPKFLPKCAFNSIYVNVNDFCSKAERREK